MHIKYTKFIARQCTIYYDYYYSKQIHPMYRKRRAKKCTKFTKIIIIMNTLHTHTSYTHTHTLHTHTHFTRLPE